MYLEISEQFCRRELSAVPKTLIGFQVIKKQHVINEVKVAAQQPLEGMGVLHG